MSKVTGWLAGSGRSGTTWLGNMMHSVAACRQIFEPLNHARMNLPADLQPRVGRGERPWLAPNTKNERWRAFIADVLAGKYDNQWTRYGHHPWKRRPRMWLESLRADHVIVKEVRSNLLLGWLASQLSLRPVLLIRHPCSTIASQLQRKWRADITPILREGGIVDDHFSEHATYLRKQLRTDEERLAARWAIENIIPLRQAATRPIAVVSYEQAVLDPVAVVKRIADHWGWRFDDDKEQSVERRANAKVSGLTTDRTADELIHAWQSSQKPEVSEAIIAVTQRLGLDMYNLDPLPHPRATSPIE